ncbi:MAG: FAD-binding protein, partial [Gammaproteobacteria bacterium]
MSLFVDKLKRLLPEELIIADEELLRVYECDALTAYRQLPRCVVMPERVDQVQAIMRLCHEENIPVVARGAGTGLSGGALPVADGLLLSLTKFNQILHLDPDQRIARAQTGVRNISVSEAAAKYGLFYAPDPSSQIACTIGGNVAENSGGVHCLKYGLTVHNILAIKLITVTGELLEIGGDALDSAGYDLLALMTGSEGMLGVIVEV